MLTQVNDETEILPAQQMVAELYEDSEKMIKMLKLVFDMSEAAGEHGLSDFIAARMDAHKKHSWMLRATLK
jgi:starvation-inducible DNA-binding protein